MLIKVVKILKTSTICLRCRTKYKKLWLFEAKNINKIENYLKANLKQQN